MEKMLDFLLEYKNMYVTYVERNDQLKNRIGATISRLSMLHKLSLLLVFVLCLHAIGSQAQMLSVTLTGKNLSSNIVIGGAATLTAALAHNPDPVGQGWLRLTPDSSNQSGYAYNKQPFRHDQGVLVEFEYKIWGDIDNAKRYQWGRSREYGDGLSIFLYDGVTNDEFEIGPDGASLGYAAKNGQRNALKGGYLCVGLDEFGNFSNGKELNGGLTNTNVSQSIAIRGPSGDARDRTLYIGGTRANFLGYLEGISYSPGNTEKRRLKIRPGDEYYRKVRIFLNPHEDQSTQPGFEIGVQLQTSKDGLFHTAIQNVHVNEKPPGRLKIGFAASTGHAVANHEIRNLQVTTPVNFAITKTVSKQIVHDSGDVLSVSLTIANIGKVSTGAVNPILISDILPKGLMLVDRSMTFQTIKGNARAKQQPSQSTKYNYKIDEQDLASIPVYLPVGSSAVITYRAVVNLPSSNVYSLTNTATISPPLGYVDQDESNNSSLMELFIKPRILNKALTHSICSAESANIVLSSSLNGTEYNWIMKKQGFNTTFVGSSTGTESTIVRALKNEGTQVGMISCVVTPTVSVTNTKGWSERIRGNPVTFSFIVKPLCPKLQDQVIEVINQPQVSIDAFSGTTERAGVSCTWYVDATTTTAMKEGKALKGGNLTVTTNEASTKVFYVSAIKDGFCESERAKIIIHSKKSVILKFQNPSVDGGASVQLIAQLSGTLRAPEGGITITLNRDPQSTAHLNQHHSNLTSIFIQQGANSGSVSIVTLGKEGEVGIKQLKVTGLVLSEGYVLANSATLAINYVSNRPEITNTDLSRTICSGEPVNISLSSTLPNTTYTWTASSKNISGFAITGTGTVIRDILMNHTQLSGTVIYTVIPKINGSSTLAGEPKVFTVTVMPFMNKALDVTKTILNQSGVDITTSEFQKTSLKTSSSNLSAEYIWYTDQACKQALDPAPAYLSKYYRIPTPKPGTYTYYVMPKVIAAGFCKPDPAKVEITADHRLSLSLNKNTVAAGEPVVLTASLSTSLTAPAGGITITLVPDNNSKLDVAILGTHYEDLSSTPIYIPEGASTGSITISTKEDHNTQGKFKLQVNGVPSDVYTLQQPPQLIINYLKYKPAIINAITSVTICSGDQLSITFESSLSNTTYEWKGIHQGGEDVTGITKDGHAGAITDTLVNTSEEVQTVVYKVIPKKAGARGQKMSFGIIIKPRNTKIFDTTLPTIDDVDYVSNYYALTVVDRNKNARQISSTFTFYEDRDLKKILEPQPGLLGHEDSREGPSYIYGFTLEKPGIYTYYSVQRSPGFCESVPTKLTITYRCNITLSFSPTIVDGGKETMLTASLSTSLVAPKGGITITLKAEESLTAKEKTHYDAFSKTIFIPAGKREGSIKLKTIANNKLKGLFNLKIIGKETSGYTIVSIPTLGINYPEIAKPAIINTLTSTTICSGEPVKISLSSTLPNTTYTWTARASSNNITGFAITGTGTVISDILMNNTQLSGTVIYTVTPMVNRLQEGDSQEIKVTVMPRYQKLIELTEHPKIPDNTSGTMIGRMLVENNRPIPDLTYRWYTDNRSTTPFHTGKGTLGKYLIPPTTPIGIHSYYITIQKEGFCESERTRFEVDVKYPVKLSFSPTIVDGGEKAALTARLPDGILAPVGGIAVKVSIDPKSTATPLDHLWFNQETITILVGQQSGTIDLCTKSNTAISGTFNLIIDGSAKDYLIASTPTLQIHYSIPPPVPEVVPIGLKFDQETIQGGATATLTAFLPHGMTATHPITIILKRAHVGSSAHDKTNYTNLITQVTIPPGQNAATVDAFYAKKNKRSRVPTTLTLEGTLSATSVTHIINKNRPEIIIRHDPPEKTKITLRFHTKNIQAGEETTLRVSLPKGVTSSVPIRIKLQKAKISTAKRNKNYESYPDYIEIPANANYAEIKFVTLNQALGESKYLYLFGKVDGPDSKKYFVETDALTIQSYIPKETNFKIPNVFTPNGNSDHDVWNITGIESYPDCMVFVYNRWGNLVFESQGYHLAWDGTFQGIPLPVTNYWYIIDLKNGSPLIHGSVALIR